MKGLLFIVLGLQSLSLHSAATTPELGRSTKIWQRDTNFENPKNWEGYEGNCSKNIFSFPMDMEPTVISLPPNTTLATKEIILPRNGHLVFQQGPTTLFNSPSDTCQGVELKFGRTARGDWFDPNNWIGSDSLLNSRAIPHVERVPCQYDWVQFPPKSSFHLLISADVVVSKFFLGEEELNYTKVAFLMSTQLGKIQFQKTPETQFELSTGSWKDADTFICQNYNESTLRKICGLAKCNFAEGRDCPNPILPHGFCCPVCGYHLIIQHNGDLRLSRVKEEVDSRIKSLGLAGMVGVHVGRFAQKFAHIVFIPWMNRTGDVRKLIDEIRTVLASDSFVLQTTFRKSWEDTSDDSNSLASTGMNGGIAALIVIVVLIMVCGTAFLIFVWSKRGYPPLTLNSVMTRLRSIPGVTSSPRPSFTFARFSNERISTINIGQTSSGEIQRTEKVDADAEPMEADVPETSSSGFGFANVTYDIIAIGVEPPTAGDESVALTDIPSTSTAGAGAKESNAEEENIYDVVEVPTSQMLDFSDFEDPKKEE